MLRSIVYQFAEPSISALRPPLPLATFPVPTIHTGNFLSSVPKPIRIISHKDSLLPLHGDTRKVKTFAIAFVSPGETATKKRARLGTSKQVFAPGSVVTFASNSY